MAKKKNLPPTGVVADAAESSASGEKKAIAHLKSENAKLKEKLVGHRKEVQHLQSKIAVANELRDSRLKKVEKNVAPVEGSRSREIENLKTLNEQLVNEVEARRSQMQRLREELHSLAADQEILVGMEGDVFGLVISSSLNEDAKWNDAEMAAMTKKAELAAAELDAAETRLLDLDRKKAEIRRDLDGIAEERDSTLRSLEKAKIEERRTWKKLIFPIAAAVTSFCVAAALVSFFGKGSNVRN